MSLAACTWPPAERLSDEWSRREEGYRTLALEIVNNQEGFWFSDEQRLRLVSAISSKPPGWVREWGQCSWTSDGYPYYCDVVLDFYDHGELAYLSREPAGRQGVRVIYLSARAKGSGDEVRKRLKEVYKDRVHYQELVGDSLKQESTVYGPTILAD
jgi:hypothetical protein